MIVYKTNTLNGAKISLPASKSIANRALIISYLTNSLHRIANLSDAEDTVNLKKNLVTLEKSTELHVGDAGTNFRFLLSLVCLLNKEVILTGSHRIKERPIQNLVNALNFIGASISYLEKENYAPLQIKAGNLIGEHIEMNGSISSQFISSLALIAPMRSVPMHISLAGKIVSKPYIDMTVNVMKQFGAKISWKENALVIHNSPYIERDFIVENDWSAAAFWFGLLAGFPIHSSLILSNLSLTSIQGDAETISIFSLFGILAIQQQEDLQITKINAVQANIQLNLVNTPDLFPAIVSAAIVTKTKVILNGLETLPMKESNRIVAMDELCKNLNIETTTSNSSFEIISFPVDFPTKIYVNTVNDHRIAMAASILCSITTVELNDGSVVKKSYPSYWNEFEKVI